MKELRLLGTQMTTFKLFYTKKADEQLDTLECSKDKKATYKAVRKALGLMEIDLKHPSLKTHKYESLQGPEGEDVFESYAQNNTPGAYRIFWYYGPNKKQITVLAVVPHP